MNVVTIIGRLTDHPELKHTSNDIAVCSFCLAVTRPKAKDKTDFINCTAWRNTAEFICKYFRKGQKMALNGSLTTDRYEDKDGNKRTRYDVLVESVYFCESKSESAEGSPTSPSAITVEAEPYVSKAPFPVDEFEEIAPLSDEDLPF